MAEIGLRVGPFEIVDVAEVPEAGRWFVARRTGQTRRQPSEVLVKLPGEDGHPAPEVLQEEFERLRTLDDSRVPHPVGFYEGQGALAVERVQGLPFATVVDQPVADRTAMGVITWVDVIVDVAATVQNAHKRGLIHGHLDGYHLWLAADGRVWTWGFGPGARIDPDPRWLPPERAQRLAPTAATDQWSLAALLVSVLTGRPPWPLDDPQAQARTGDPDLWLAPIASRWPSLGRILRKMLDPVPGHRYPTVQAARQDLLGQLRSLGGLSERRALGAWIARLGGLEGDLGASLDEELNVVRPDVDGDVPVARTPGDEDVDDEATVLVDPEQLKAELEALRAAREIVTLDEAPDEPEEDSAFGPAEPTWPGEEAPHDQEKTMLFSDRAHLDDYGTHDHDTDSHHLLEEAVIALDDEEDSLAQTLDTSAIPISGEIREITDEKGPPPMDIPIDDLTAEKFDVPIYSDEEESGPYHTAIDLTEIDTAPNESLHGVRSPLPLPPREMSLPEKLASWLLAVLAASMLLWFLVQVT